MTSISTLIDALTTKFGNEDGVIMIPQDELVKALGSFKSEKLGRVRKAKKEKDPNAPKRPTSAYMRWLNENRQMIKDTYFQVNEDGDHCYPEDHENVGQPLVGRDKVTLITKKAGILWKDVSKDEKAPFQKLFEEASVAYKEAKGIYHPTEPKDKYDVKDVPDAPDGWTGPHHLTYLPKVSKDPESGKNFKVFKTFDEAVEAANDIEEGCAGITKTSTGYSLRIGPELRRNPPENINSGIASWVKGTDEPTIVDSSPKTSPKSSPKIKRKVAPKAESNGDQDEDTQTNNKETKTKPKTKPKKTKKVVIKEPEPEPEPEPESSGDELEVETINIDGKDYYLDSDSGDIYDTETNEIVGKSENGKHTIF
jgi:hypothetical protein